MDNDARMVEIEYVGDPPILDETTRLRMAMGELPAGSMAVLRAAESARSKVVKGVSIRRIDPDYFPGLSGSMDFGPDVFTKLVSYSDAEIILGSEAAHQFRLAGKNALHVEIPPNDIALVSETDFDFAATKQALR